MNWLRCISLLVYIVSFFYYMPTCANSEKCEPKNVCITIFVHGIISIQPYISLTNVVRLKLDRIADTIYARAVELTRKDPFFFQHHPTQGLGLQKINLESIVPGNASAAFARAYDTLSKRSNYCSGKNLYYTFGWSGLLSRKMRTMEAEVFYRSLSELLHTYYKQGIHPKIRIIGYSHGGRVALELAVAQYLVESKIPLSIDELILIGMPVAPASIAKIQDPIFKKVYHIYSYGDRVQPIDFFSVKGFLSNRTFKSTSSYTLPEKLIQINFKVYRLSRFYQKKWEQCSSNCTPTYRHLRGAHPGHVELWSFGWTPQNYRRSLPYYPLPAAVFIPYLIQSINLIPCANYATVEIHTYNESIIVKANKPQICHTMPFLTAQEQIALRNDALMFTPLTFSHELFRQHSQAAHYQAKQQKYEEWKKQRKKNYHKIF